VFPLSTFMYREEANAYRFPIKEYSYDGYVIILCQSETVSFISRFSSDLRTET
jgi:hypothetical protein